MTVRVVASSGSSSVLSCRSSSTSIKHSIRSVTGIKRQETVTSKSVSKAAQKDEIFSLSLSSVQTD